MTLSGPSCNKYISIRARLSKCSETSSYPVIICILVSTRYYLYTSTLHLSHRSIARKLCSSKYCVSFNTGDHQQQATCKHRVDINRMALSISNDCYGLSKEYSKISSTSSKKFEHTLSGSTDRSQWRYHLRLGNAFAYDVHILPPTLV